MHVPHFVYPFTSGRTLGLFLLFGSHEEHAVNMDVHRLIWVPVFNSLGYMPGHGIAGSYTKELDFPPTALTTV